MCRKNSIIATLLLRPLGWIFATRRGGTKILTKRTLAPNEVIGEILDANYSFIPIAIGPHCVIIGSLFKRIFSLQQHVMAERHARSMSERFHSVIHKRRKKQKKKDRDAVIDQEALSWRQKSTPRSQLNEIANTERHEDRGT
eukprot:scaffold55878_cov22-Cyclotella_meneghiniana.AAC.1